MNSATISEGQTVYDLCLYKFGEAQGNAAQLHFLSGYTLRDHFTEGMNFSYLANLYSVNQKTLDYYDKHGIVPASQR